MILGTCHILFLSSKRMMFAACHSSQFLVPDILYMSKCAIFSGWHLVHVTICYVWYLASIISSGWHLVHVTICYFHWLTFGTYLKMVLCDFVVAIYEEGHKSFEVWLMHVTMQFCLLNLPVVFESYFAKHLLFSCIFHTDRISWHYACHNF